jgi:putative DNA primase/helicase
MPVVDSLKGAAVRLFDADDVIGVAEGVETAIACHQRDRLPVWSVISTAGMESFVPPDGVRRVVVYADNDANFAGQKAAFALASRLTRENFTVDVRIPPETDTDWLDVLVDDLRGRNG